jgi:carboxylesterase type B
MNAYVVNFVKTGNPNGQGLPLWAQAPAGNDPIQRQIIDVDTRRAAFPEQSRYEKIVPILAGQ